MADEEQTNSQMAGGEPSQGAGEAEASQAAEGEEAPTESTAGEGGQEGEVGSTTASKTASTTASKTPSGTVSKTPSGGASQLASGASRTPSGTASRTPSGTASRTPSGTASRTPSGTASGPASRTPSGAGIPGSRKSLTSSSKEGKKRKKSRSKKSKKGKIDLAEAKIGFVGAGKITEAIVDGFLEYGQVASSQMYVASHSSRNLERFKTKGIKVSKRPYDIFSRFDCDIIFLCFHGKVVKECYSADPDRPRSFCGNFIPSMRHPLYILSLVSGCTVDEVKGVLLNPDHPDKYDLEIHRVMINAACAYGLGLCAIDCEVDGKRLSNPLRTLLTRIARLEHVPGDQMDAACATGGYGLAFAYYFISAMADGAVKIGLSRELANQFAAKTAQSGAQTVSETGSHPDQLRDQVISPGGAAIEGIHQLEKTEFSHAIASAVETAFTRAQALSKI